MKQSIGRVIFVAVIFAAVLGLGVMIGTRVNDKAPAKADHQQVAINANQQPSTHQSRLIDNSKSEELPRNSSLPTPSISTESADQAAQFTITKDTSDRYTPDERVTAIFDQVATTMPNGDRGGFASWHQKVSSEPRDQWSVNAEGVLASYLPAVLSPGMEVAQVQCSAARCEILVIFSPVGKGDPAVERDAATEEWVSRIRSVAAESWWSASGFGAVADVGTIQSPKYGQVLIADVQRAGQSQQ